MAKAEQIALLFYVLASTFGVIIIKKFLKTVQYEDILGFLSQLFNIQLIFGVFLYIAGFLTWLYVLSRVDLNIAYPVAITLSFVAVLMASILILKETFTINIGIGTVVCLIGVFIILR